MSLVRIAVRIAAVEALKGRTLVGDNVLDSEIGSLDIGADGLLRSAEDRPYIAVYTDSAKAQAGIDLRAFVQNGETEILFESSISTAMTETANDGTSTLIGIGTPATDRGFEFHLDMLARQIGDALTDPANEWGQVFLSLIQGFNLVERSRISSVEGTRMAGHQLKLTVSLIADPVRGELRPTSAFAKFLAKAAELQDEEKVEFIEAICSQLAGDEFSWVASQRRYGMTAGEMSALLLTPAMGAEADVAVVEVASAPAEITP